MAMASPGGDEPPGGEHPSRHSLQGDPETRGGEAEVDFVLGPIFGSPLWARRAWASLGDVDFYEPDETVSQDVLQYRRW